MELENTDNFCRSASENLYGDLPNRILEDDRDIETAEYEIREKELPPTG